MDRVGVNKTKQRQVRARVMVRREEEVKALSEKVRHDALSHVSDAALWFVFVQ